TPDEAAASQFGQDVAQAVIGVAWRRRIIDGQQHPGERLYQEQKHSHAAEHLAPAARRGNLFGEEVARGGLNPGAMVQPVGQSLPMLLHAGLPEDGRRLPSSNLPPWIFVS